MRKQATKTFIPLILLSIALIFCVSTVSAANDIYVNNATGNDSWTGTDPLYQGGIIGPKATIQNGTDTVDPNGFVYVANGVYQENINISKNLNLIGQSMVGTIIDGKYTGRPINILNSGLIVSIINFTLINGTIDTDSTAQGGGIYNNGTLTMNNCNVTNNLAAAVGSANTRAYGGGIYNNGALTMTDCFVDNNVAESIDNGNFGENAFGGGIYNHGTLTMTNCNVNDNIATASGTQSESVYGGGIENDGGVVTMTGCNINDNTISGVAKGVNAFGGGIDNNNHGVLTLTNCNVDNNILSISDNGVTAYAYGGGIATGNGCILTMINCNVNSNICSAGSSSGDSGINGGGIWNYGTSNMTSCNVNNNMADATATGDVYVSGAGIENVGILTMSGCNVNNNTAVAIANLGQADASGAGINNAGTLTMTNCNVTQNTATALSTAGTADSYGGAIKNTQSCSALSCTITGNTANNGGGVYTNSSELTVNYCRILDNHNSDVTNEAQASPDLRYNWWGQNSGPISGQVIGTDNYKPWLFLTFSPNPTTIPQGSTSTLTASFNNLFDGLTLSSYTPTAALFNYLPNGSPVTFTTTLGNVGSKSVVKYTFMGIATAILRGDEAVGDAVVGVLADRQPLTATVTITPVANAASTTTVNGQTIVMQTTGAPIIPLAIAVLSVLCGLATTRKKQ
jgi:autotransporter family porin